VPGADDLKAVLESVGVNSAVASAIREVDRSQFAPATRRGEAFLNASVPLDGTSTWLSEPGVVALMVSQLRPYCGQQLLEIGMGTGYHAAVILSLLPEAHLTGVDPNPVALEVADKLMKRLGFESRVSLVEGYAQSIPPSDWDTVYCTAASKYSPISLASEVSVRRPLVLQTPRALNRREYDSEPDDSWLKVKFGSYEEYMSRGWREYLAITTYLITASEPPTELESIYDVTFVPFEEPDLRASTQEV